MKLFRSRCERCGTLTTSPSWTEVAIRIYRSPDGSEWWSELCPECRALWERMLSTFLTPADAE